MKIQSKEIPQADILDDVVKVVFAVSKGAKTFQEIAKVIQKVGRQGRYYRLAAELLGFIENHQNSASLTSLGNLLIRSKSEEREAILLVSILNSRMIQRLLPFLETEKETSRSKFDSFIKEVTEPVGATMIPRRSLTIINWLRRVGMVTEKEGKISLNKLPSIVQFVEFKDDTEPLLPKTFDLTEYKQASERIKKIGSYTILVDEAKKERAVKKHEWLTYLVAKRIKDAGSIPRRNKFIDLATQHDGLSFIFEIKSSTEDNVHSQIRKGISQLYEYKYIQNVDNAELVLVIENKPLNKQEWLIDYLLNNRNISIIWDNKNDNLFCPRSLEAKLDFLKPIYA